MLEFWGEGLVHLPKPLPTSCSPGSVRALADLFCMLSSGACGCAESYHVVLKYKWYCLFCKHLYMGAVPLSTRSVYNMYHERHGLCCGPMLWAEHPAKYCGSETGFCYSEPNAIACRSIALPLCWKEWPWYSQKINICLLKHSYFV